MQKEEERAAVAAAVADVLKCKPRVQVIVVCKDNGVLSYSAKVHKRVYWLRAKLISKGTRDQMLKSKISVVNAQIAILLVGSGIC